MNIILTINIYTPSDKIGLNFSKHFESSVLPSEGTLIKDPIFAELKPIKNIIIDYSENTCYVELNGKEVPDGRLDGHIQEVALLHDWTLVE